VGLQRVCQAACAHVSLGASIPAGSTPRQRDSKKSMSIVINWTPYDTLAPDTIFCRCGEMFWSHTQFSAARVGQSHHKIISRKPCPRCGKNDSAKTIRAARHIRALV
jgi:hypothetical protein